MNKKSVLNSIKIIVLGLILSGGISYMQTAIAAFPAGNPPAFINVSSTAQVKTGPLGIGALIGWQATPKAADLYGDVKIVGSSSPTARDLYVSGKTGIGIASPVEALEVNGNIRLGAFDYSYSSTAQNQNANPNRLCADTSGKIVLCPHGSQGFSTNCTDSNPCTFTVPDGVFKINVSVLGGGGGGGGHWDTGANGGGGGGGGSGSGGGMNVLPGQQITDIVVGKGGTAGTIGPGNGPDFRKGGNGGDSHFGYYFSGLGGGGGGGGLSSPGAGGIGPGGCNGQNGATAPTVLSGGCGNGGNGGETGPYAQLGPHAGGTGIVNVSW
jgi:hypothetical protein